MPSIEALEDFIRKVAKEIPAVTVVAASRPLRLLHGLNVQAIRHAEASLVLRENGFGNEATICTRAALEHAVTSQWCYFTKTGIDRLQAEVERDMKSYYQLVGSWLDRLDVVAAADAMATPTHVGLPKFTGSEGIMGSIDADVFLRMSYKILSASVHVTHSTALSYLEILPGAETLTAVPNNSFEYPTTYSAAAAAMLAAWVEALLTGDTNRLAQLDALSDTLKLPVSLEDAIDLKWK